MRLIVSVDALHPPLTGIGRYTWELVRRLQTRDDLRQLRFFRNERWVTEPARLLDAEEPKHAAAGSAEAPSKRREPGPKAGWPVWARSMYWRTTCRYNVFHAPNYFLPPYARHGVVTVHDLSIYKYPQTHPAERLRQFERSFGNTLAIASQLITDSQAVRDEVIAHFSWPAERITAVPLGVSPDYRPRDPEALEALLRERGLRFGGYTLCVSTVEPRKRIDALLAAYRELPPLLRAAFPLVLAGGAGWQSDALHQAIDRAREEGWLHYLGFVAEAEMPQLYAGARLFAYPSIYEGFGLPILEAMASGVPVLTSNRSCLPEVAGGAGKLVDPDDIEQFAAAIEAALTDEAWRAQAVPAGLAVAARHTWDACVDATVAVYRRALG